MAQSSGYGAGPGSVDLTAGVTGGTSGTTGGIGTGGTGTGGSGTTDQAKDKAQQAAGQAKDQAQQVAGQAKEQAQQVAGKAQGLLRTQVDTRSTQAGEQIKSQASDIRTIGDQLRSQGKDKPAQLVDQAAQRIEGIGDYLQRADADAIIDDIERFARQRPWAILAGGLSLGFIAARGLKASSTERYQAGGSSARRQGLPATAGTANYGDGGSYGGGSYGGGSYGGSSTGGGSYGGSSTGGYVGGGISGTEDVTTVPPATTVPPVSTDVPRTPPAGGL
jgi:ElaB/YqjD/DUF883 family membrane-anchored ribosome-binding protein